MQNVTIIPCFYPPGWHHPLTSAAERSDLLLPYPVRHPHLPHPPPPTAAAAAAAAGDPPHQPIAAGDDRDVTAVTANHRRAADYHFCAADSIGAATSDFFHAATSHFFRAATSNDVHASAVYHLYPTAPDDLHAPPTAGPRPWQPPAGPAVPCRRRRHRPPRLHYADTQ